MISVIIPFYNSSDYLANTIDGILKQTYLNLEILLINDGSTDESLEICNRYRKKDKRIKIYNQENLGVATARNLGLKMASGNYIAFIDSDDTIHPKYFEYLHKAINEGPFNIALTLYENDIIQSSNKKLFYKIKYNVKLISQNDFINKLFLSMKVGEIDSLPLGVVWGKLYRKKFLENLFFKNLYISSDIEFSSRICWKMGDSILIPEKMYYWKIHKNSLSHKDDNSTKKLESELDLWLHILSNFPDILKLKNYRGICLEQLYKKFLYIRKKKININSHYKSQIAKYKFELLSNNYILIKIKIGIILFYNIPFLYRVYNKIMVK
ncbi:MAG: glycosyltransferase family 2 protein [Erysipelotrichales bacterium]|nr:glycosyltransferase family 2 protein [Erysipelotrichales bacterium]